MTDITVDSVMSNDDIKSSFDETFVLSFMKKIPQILKLDEDELTLGHIAMLTKQPRAAVGRFLQVASEMKDFPIGMVNRTPIIKNIGNKTQTASKKDVGSSEGTQFNQADVARSIINALLQEPVGETDKRYASVETLSDELDVPVDFVAKVIDNLRGRGIVSLYEGEMDFDEVVFFLNKDALEKGKKEAQIAKSKKSKAASKSATKANNTEDKTEVKTEVKSKAPKSPAKTNKTTAQNNLHELLTMKVPKKTMDAVKKAMQEDKFTRNGILSAVAKKGVHQRNHVEAAFRQLVDKGIAIPTNDGGAREYYTIEVEDSGVTQDSSTQTEKSVKTSVSTESKDVSKSDDAVADSDFSDQERVVTKSDNAVISQTQDKSAEQSLMDSIGISMDAMSRKVKSGVTSQTEVSELLNKVESVTLMLKALDSMLKE